MASLLLTKSKGGINRQQVVGSPPAATLYDLLNGYLYNGQRYVSRQGTRAVYDLPVGLTKGMCAFNGEFVVFSGELQTVPAGVVCEVLNHPTIPGLSVSKIHFAGPFLRFLYVVAEFADGNVYHYWLRGAETWEPSRAYSLGFLVEPTVENGFVYRAGRLNDAYPLWAPSVLRAVTDRIEPTVPDNFFYEVVNVIGTTPRSGTTEPDWNAEDGAITVEDVSASGPSTPVVGPPTVPANPDPDGVYNNPGGSRPPTGGTDSRSEQ